jgi:hypothetical protein
MHFICLPIAIASSPQKAATNDGIIQFGSWTIPIARGELNLGAITTVPTIAFGRINFSGSAIRIHDGVLALSGISTSPEATWSEFSLDSETTTPGVEFGSMELGGDSLQPPYNYDDIPPGKEVDVVPPVKEIPITEGFIELGGESYAIASTTSDLGEFSNITTTPHADTLAFYKRIVANGGSVSWTDLDIIEASFVLPIYEQNLRSLILESWIPVGNNLAAVSTKLWHPSTVQGRVTLVNFVEGDYTRSLGLTGDGSSKYGRTGFIPSGNLAANSITIALYTKAETSAAQMDLYAQSSSTSALGLITKWSDGKAYWDCNNTAAGAGRLSTSSTTLLPGFKLGTRTTATNTRIHRNGNSVASGSTSGGTLPTHELYLHAGNNAGTPMNFSSKTIGLYLIGTGWTAAQVTSINAIVQNIMRALGRN